ncbi:MAG: TadE/TadG family type IV pilus assembly protein, partial [Planctomycetota bacterium]
MQALILPSRVLRRRAGDGERGQALVFGALTLFMLACFVIFISDLSMVTSTRIQMQNAADECAYAGSLYEANVVSSVAYLNEAMAWMYYDALRYAVDTTMAGTLANLKRYGDFHDGPNPSNEVVYEDYDEDAPGWSGSPVAVYDRAYQRARDHVPEIERTLAMFSRWEWGMALSAAELVTMEVNRVALSHGIDAIAMYPKVDFFPGNGVQ